MVNPDTTSEYAQSGTQSIDRAANLLVRVLESTLAPTVGELAVTTDLPKSTTSRLVRALEPRLGAVAAPVFDRGSGEAVAALSISGPTIRLTPARLNELGALLIVQAAGLSARLGHHDAKRGAA